MTSVTLTIDLWPWYFVWTSFLSLVITPDNFTMIRWQEHCQKGDTDRQTDRWTDGQVELEDDKQNILDFRFGTAYIIDLTVCPFYVYRKNNRWWYERVVLNNIYTKLLKTWFVAMDFVVGCVSSAETQHVPLALTNNKTKKGFLNVVSNAVVMLFGNAFAVTCAIICQSLFPITDAYMRHSASMC